MIDNQYADPYTRIASLQERCARLQQALTEMEGAALKAAQLLPMTLSTSVEKDHRDDHASWAGWLLRHKVLPVAREALAGPDTLTAGDQGERPDGTGRVAPADGCAERQSTADPSPAASAGPDTPADSQEDKT